MYYSCDKKNHFAKNYKSKNVVQRQFNVTLKKNSKHKKKNEKKSIIKQSKFHQLISKTKNFTKLTNDKIFKTFCMKKNKTAIQRLRKSTQRLTILISTNLCFNDSKHFIQIQQKKIKLIKIKIIKQMRK